MLLPAWRSTPRPIIGMLHCPALPASPLYGGSMKDVLSAVLRDADALSSGGVHGLMIENFFDVPFFPGRVPAHVVAHLTALAAHVRRRFPDLPLGINVLRNDGLSALAVAQAAGAEFVRVNVLCSARLADQGLIHGIAHDLLRLRRELGAESIKILADVDVKHSAPLAKRDLRDEVEDTVRRALADGLIASGAGTGKPTDVGKLAEIKSAAGDVPVFVGSGVTPRTIAALAQHANGFIVGTYFKENDDPAAPVKVDRVRELVKAL